MNLTHYTCCIPWCNAEIFLILWRDLSYGQKRKVQISSPLIKSTPNSINTAGRVPISVGRQSAWNHPANICKVCVVCIISLFIPFHIIIKRYLSFHNTIANIWLNKRKSKEQSKHCVTLKNIWFTVTRLKENPLPSPRQEHKSRRPMNKAPNWTLSTTDPLITTP